VFQLPLVVFARVLHTAIGMSHQAWVGKFSLYGHLQGIDNESAIDSFRHGPTDDLP